MAKSEFEKDIEIDLENLEVMATIQPSLYFKYSSAYAEAKAEADHAKMQMEVMEAKLCRKARANPSAMGVHKVTNESIKEAVHVHPSYVAKYKKWINAKKNEQICFAAQNSMEHKKRMIEVNVQLQGREYFASPNKPHTPQQFKKRIAERRKEKTHERMVNKIRKRKKK